MEHFVMTAMQDAALKALISDLGEGIVIDPELLEGCSVAAHDLDDMDAVQAAEVAAHVFLTLFETKVSEQSGESAEPEEGEWSGFVNGFRFVIERDGDGDLVVDFSEGSSSSGL
ncbi:MAG: hypothetical protein CMK24_06725 [Porticoccaceae bacterium]|nr:hypothetical protein [Porticoccaceae bacterium]